MKNDQKRPLISFVVSVYNLERYIRECLDSILSQPFDDYEIMLVNNSSTDGSDAICREYAAKYSQIRYYALTGEPILGRATVHGAQESRGQYIQFVDVDDMLAPNIYDRVATTLREERPEVMFGRFNSVFEDEMLNFPDRPYSESHINSGNKADALAYLAANQPVILATWRLIVARHLCGFIHDEEKLEIAEVVETEVLVENDSVTTPNIIDEPEEVATVELSPNLHYDVCSMVYTLIAAKSIRYIDEPIYEYRIRASSISRITPTIQVSSCCIALLDLLLITNDVVKTDAERAFVRVYADQFYYQLCTALCTLDDHEFELASTEVHNFLSNRNYNKTFKSGYPMLDEMVTVGTVETLKKYQVQTLAKLHDIVQTIDAKNGDIYLCPTGNIGQYLKTGLELNGAIIKGFFDNDKQKHGMVVDGATIYSPEIVKELSLSEKPFKILIGTRYENARPELVKQFVDLGVSPDDIIVIDM